MRPSSAKIMLRYSQIYLGNATSHRRNASQPKNLFNCDFQHKTIPKFPCLILLQQQTKNDNSSAVTFKSIFGLVGAIEESQALPPLMYVIFRSCLQGLYQKYTKQCWIRLREYCWVYFRIKPASRHDLNGLYPIKWKKPKDYLATFSNSDINWRAD